MELLRDTWPWRLALGLGLLAVLAAIDLVRHPKNPTRIKEYGFLFAVTGATMVHGLVHDLVTWSFSPEYFAVGKGLGDCADSFFPEVAALALKASWSAGLFIGLVLLIANNPSKRRPQLPYRRLARFVLWPLACSVGAAVVAGLASYLSGAAEFSQVWAIHIGTYVGALVGVITGAVLVRRERTRLPC